ncbi:hypothetical protein B7463_g9077, partial [Scytalidium lignicola]
MSYTQYQQYSGNPYANGPDAEAGQVEGQTYDQNHLQAPGLAQEMSNYSQESHYSNSGAPAATAPTVLSQQNFLDRVDFAKAEIRTLTSNIQEIASFHQRALSSPDSSLSAQLEDLVTKTQLKNTQIRDQIKFLELDAAKTHDGTKNIKDRQVKQLKGDFDKELKSYQQEEMGYKQRYREQIARQYRIVNPDATEEEVGEAAEMDWGSEGVFQTALKNNRSGQATSVLGAVRARHNELQRIEATLTELASMFADMAQLVEAQDPVVQHTEQNAQKTAEDVDKANAQIQQGIKHARNRNKLKWWCLLVVFLIVLAIALGVGLGIGLAKSNK